MCRLRLTAEDTSGDIREGPSTTGPAALTRSMVQFAIDGSFWVRKPASWVIRSQTRREHLTVLAVTTTSKTARSTGLLEPALMKFTAPSAISGQHWDGNEALS